MNSAATPKGQRRRCVLGAGLALDVTSVLPRAQATSASRYVQPDAEGWPDASQWAELNEAVGGRLSRLTLPDLSDPAIQTLLTNPFYIGEQAGLTQNSGWLDAWQASPSAYAVAATSPADVAATVDFARRHNVRLVIKGGGHSYLGSSSAPGSLLIWTRPMNTIAIHDAFSPQGAGVAPVPAVSVGAGCIWLDVYHAVTGGSGRYVQGGGCTTVGVAGLVQIGRRRSGVRTIHGSWLSNSATIRRVFSLFTMVSVARSSPSKAINPRGSNGASYSTVTGRALTIGRLLGRALGRSLDRLSRPGQKTSIRTAI